MLNLKQISDEMPSAADLAYDGIISLVLNSELRPGERTSVNLLAARLGIGRTPVKEAITRLQTEGLLSISGRSGTTINRIGRHQTEQLFESRRMLEDFAANLVVLHATEEDIIDIKKYLKDLGQSDNTSDFVRANIAFHSKIIATAGNLYLDRFYSQLQMQLQIVTYLSYRGFDPRATDARQREHVRIVQALETRSAEALRTALRVHTATTEKAILMALASAENRDPGARR